MKSPKLQIAARRASGLSLATFLATCLLSIGSASAQAVIHVPADQPTIQQAIDMAVDGDLVFIAPGTYYETINFLGKNIRVSGSGGAQAVTINGNQAGTVVVFENGETAAAVLEHVTITGGYGNVRPAGGIYCGQADPTIRYCVIANNHGSDAFDGAGGIQCNTASPAIRYCTIRRNIGSVLNTRGGAGGMIVLWNSSPVVFETVFEENRGADSTDGGPGAFRVDSGADLVLTSCTFRMNQGGQALGCNDGGSGAGDIRSSDTTITDCTFEANVAGRGQQGPGALLIHSGTTVIRGTLFLENEGSSCPPQGYQGIGGPGAIRSRADLRVMTSEFRANRGGWEEAGAISTRGVNGPDLTDSLFVGNIGGPGDYNAGPGAVLFSGLVNLQPRVTRCVFEDNIGGHGRFGGGPGAFTSTCGGVVAECLFQGNQGGGANRGDGGPGALTCTSGSTICFESTRFINNTGGEGSQHTPNTPNAAHGGAGAIASISGEPVFRNCVIMNNTGGSSTTYAAGAGAIEAGPGAPIFVNCTVVGNAAGTGLGGAKPSGMLVHSGMAGQVVNSIFWNDESSAEFTATAPVNFCLVRGGFPGDGNIDADPNLVDTAAGDIHLRCASPCRDAASNQAPELAEFDVDGDPRVVGLRADIGADEYNALPAGTSYCLSTPNSTGSAAAIDARGCNSLADGNLPLRAGPVPDTFGAFFYGTDSVQVPFANGTRCVGGMVVRRAFRPISGNVLVDSLDYSAPPIPAAQITIGSTWYFQAYFRDVAGGGAQVDLSDGLQITFEP